MDDFNFNIENDILYRNEIEHTEQPNVFHVKKVPVMSKEVFITLYDEWIVKKEEENDTAAK